jgi:hypothetical protein
MAEAKLEVAEVLEREEAFRVLTKYSVAHPRTLASSSRFMLNDPGETVAEQIEEISAVVPFVRLPKPSG